MPITSSSLPLILPFLRESFHGRSAFEMSHTLPRPSVIRLENMCSAPIPSPHIIIRRFPRLGSKIRKFMRI